MKSISNIGNMSPKITFTNGIPQNSSSDSSTITIVRANNENGPSNPEDIAIRNEAENMEESKMVCEKSSELGEATNENSLSIGKNNPTEKDLAISNEDTEEANTNCTSASNSCDETKTKDLSKSEHSSSETESETDSDDSSSFPKQPLPVLRPGFKPRGRMFKTATPAAAPQFIMDVPEMWGVGADGSMMEVFNKLEIKE